MICCGYGAGHEHGVDEASRDGGAGLREDDCEGAGGSFAIGEAGVGVGDV